MQLTWWRLGGLNFAGVSDGVDVGAGCDGAAGGRQLSACSHGVCINVGG